MTNEDLYAALKADHARIKRNRDAAEKMLEALKAVYYDPQSGSLLTRTQTAVELAIIEEGNKTEDSEMSELNDLERVEREARALIAELDSLRGTKFNGAFTSLAALARLESALAVAHKNRIDSLREYLRA